MSWHPYDRHRRVWTVYWGERAPVGSPSDSAAGADDVIEFELTEPYALDRDDWRDLQLKFLLRVSPPDHTLNISQLWSRLRPQDGALRFNKFNDLYKVPVFLTAQADRDEQPGKRKDYFWVMAQFQPNMELLDEIIYFQNIDLENITWITSQPLTPWPSQLFLYNEAAMAWNGKLLQTVDMDKLVRQECWGLSITHLGHLDFMTTRERCSPDEIFQILREEAAGFDLEIESTTFAKRPNKPNFIKSLGALPGNVVYDGWDQLKNRNKRRR